MDLIPKVREAVNYGLQVLDSAFEQLDIKAGNSDSEEDDANERVELILEPKVQTCSSNAYCCTCCVLDTRASEHVTQRSRIDSVRTTSSQER